jgi:acyl carrier protein
VICGSEALDELLKEQILQKGYALYNNYGPTEITVDALSTRCGNEKVTIGKPVSNKKCYILDNKFNPVPIGIAGELCIGGAGLARGYLNRPELTAEKFIPDSFSDEPGARLYRTGDLARYLPDGNIEFLGRIDHQVKVRGFRIELGEIESALEQHPAVRETAVIAREEQRGNKRLVAYVVFNQNAEILTTELRSFLKEKLPDYMVPSAFVVLDSLPLTPSGKVDRRALPAPDSARPGAEDSYVAPRTPLEEVLAVIWCEILGLNQVGIHDNFFELGGHSLLATQVISRLRKVFEVEIPLRTLFESPTVEKLAFALLQRESEREKLEKRAALLLTVAELSEDEVNAMLEDRIRQKYNRTNE